MSDAEGLATILTDPMGHEAARTFSSEDERVAQSTPNELGTYLRSLSPESRGAFREKTTGKFSARVRAHVHEQKLDVAVRLQEVKIEGSTAPDWDSVEVLPIGPADHWGGTPAAPVKPPPTEREKVEQDAALALDAMARWAHILDYWASMGSMPGAAGAAASGQGLISTGAKLGKGAVSRLALLRAGAKALDAPMSGTPLETTLENGATVRYTETATAIGDDANTLQNLARSRGAAGHDLIIHGTMIEGEGQFIANGVPTHPQQVADALLGNPYYKAGPLQLATCYGACGPAAEIKEILVVEVAAKPGSFNSIQEPESSKSSKEACAASVALSRLSAHVRERDPDNEQRRFRRGPCSRAARCVRSTRGAAGIRTTPR